MPKPIKLPATFYIARNFSECYSCSANIPVIAIAAEKFTVQNELGNEITHGLTFFFMPTFLGEEIINIISCKFEFFKSFYSNTVKIKYWANHCIYCGKGQGDFYLHSEPGAAFFPTEINEFKSIELIQINTNIDVLLEAEYSSRNYTEQLLKYAKVIPLNKI